MNNKPKTKEEILQEMKMTQRVKQMRVKANELKDLLIAKDLKMKTVRIALQVLPMMMQQASSKRANDMLVKDFGLDELVNKDSDYDIYRDMTQLFNDVNIMDAVEILNGMYQEIGRSLEKETDQKSISEIEIDIL